MNPEHAPIPSISVEGLIASRDNAVAALAQCRNILDEARRRLASFGIALPRIEMQFPGGSYRDICEPDYQVRIRKEVDRQAWLAVFKGTSADLVMDSDTRRKLHHKLYESDAYGRGDSSEDLPELTVETLRATLEEIHATRGTYFENCVEAVYRRLSWDHKTNTPGLIGEVLIVSGLYTQWSARYPDATASLNHHEALEDLERVLAILDGQPPPTYGFGLRSMSRVPFGEWTAVPSPTRPLMEIKVHRKGTAHVRILDRQHVASMNAILSRRYPGQVGTGDRHKGRRARARAY